MSLGAPAIELPPIQLSSFPLIGHNSYLYLILTQIRIVCISDTHCKTTNLKVPEGDLLIHAGDFTSRGTLKEVIHFNEFISKCYSCVNLVLFLCYSRVILVLILCYSRVILVLFSCYSRVVLVLFSCYSCVVLVW